MNEIIQTFLDRQQELQTAVWEHLGLSLLALSCAVLTAVPLAVWLSSRRRQAEAVLQLTNVVQTIPSLALLGLLIPFTGIGTLPALIALTLYALLPIFQNTYLGLSQIDASVREAAEAFGLSRWQKLWRVELPMAMPALVSGIRTAAVLIIGTATLAALVGAGGLGNIILLGIDRHNMSLTLIGAAASALLAVAVSAAVLCVQHCKHRMAVFAVLLVLAGASGVLQTASAPSGGQRQTVVIAGKLGSEPEILINMYKQLIEEADPDVEVVLKPNFGKTGFLFNALVGGDIDIYPEFTGTVLESLVELPAGTDGRLPPDETYRLAARLLAEQHGLRLLPPMRYQNTYTLAMPSETARFYGLQRVSDLSRVKDRVRAGFTLEFIDRQDGYKGLSKTHGIALKHVSGIEPALRYTALKDGRIDLSDAYSTDPEIRRFNLTVLEDDLGLFRSYQGAPLMKAEFAERYPKAVVALNRLAGRISETEMAQMNLRVQTGEAAADVAADYLSEHFPNIFPEGERP